MKSNDFYGGYIATKHLIEKGYRNIAYIAQMKYQTSTERCQGYISALLEQNIKINRRLIILSTGDDSRSTYEIAKGLIAEEPYIDAVFCFNDYVAHDVCRAIRDSGLRVSDDIGVIGYDNIASDTSITPQLTSVAYKSMEIGEAAANVLSDLFRESRPAPISISICSSHPLSNARAAVDVQQLPVPNKKQLTT